MTYEHDRALMEGARNSACDDYFSARPQIDTIDRRRVYEAGFQAGSASRDAEIEVLQSNQANVEETHKLTLREVQRELMRLQTENDQLRAHINKLREALSSAESALDESRDYPVTYDEVITALITTPEQSIAKYRNKVIEDCAITIENCEPDEHGRLSIQEIAEAVSAMKEQP